MPSRGFSRAVWLFPACVGACALLALAVPSRRQSWVRAPAQLVELLVAPVSGPVSRLCAWVSPRPAPASPGRLGELEQENAELRTQLLAASAENEHLRDLLAQARVLAAQGVVGVDQLPAPVIGASADLARPTLTLRVGTRDGAEPGTVATVSFVHLLGRVTEARPRSCTVLPITARASGDLDAVIMRSGAPLRAQLSPAGDGTLVGDVEDKRDGAGEAVLPSVGDEVRLRDSVRWPASAQMLLVGKVEAVEPSPKQPLRKIVRVRPVVGDLLRVGEVVLHLTPTGSRMRTAGAEEEP
jgi:hypothetical protein